MELPRNELVAKLENISQLYENTRSIQREMDNFAPEDHYEREVTVPKFPGEYGSERQRQLWQDKLDHTYEGALELAERTHREVYGPKEPEKPNLTAFKKPEDRALKEKIEKCKNRSYLGAGVGIFFFLGIISCIASGDFNVLPVIIILALAGAAAFVFFRYKGNEAKAAEEKMVAEALAVHNRQQEELKAEYAKKLKAYESECAEYEVVLQKFMEDYRAWREVYLQSVEEEAQIADKLEEDRVAAVEKIYQDRFIPAEKALNENNDLVAEKYLPALTIIIDLLKSRRADDLKEAINLLEDMIYRERQLALEREKEEQRQHEEQLRRQDEERHHKEQMKFQQEQERQRKYEAEKQLRMQEQHHKDEMRLQQDRLRQEAAAAKASRQKRCDNCIHKSKCRTRYYEGAYNCTGFSPDGGF